MLRRPQAAFVQGTIYHCGLCNPAFPPFVEYPLVERATNEAEALAALTNLAAADVEVVYLGPGLATDASAQLASELGMITLGAEAPPSQSEGAWAATLAPDLVQALEQAWQALGEPRALRWCLGFVSSMSIRRNSAQDARQRCCSLPINCMLEACRSGLTSPSPHASTTSTIVPPGIPTVTSPGS